MLLEIFGILLKSSLLAVKYQVLLFPSMERRLIYCLV